uniref:Uncharacterized protein n=1 Tax=Strigamia maritima TaxID=126957 RepID=T1JNG8_STRMM
MCENIFKKAMEVITEKRQHINDSDEQQSVNAAIRAIKIAYNGHNINTITAGQLDFSQLSYRRARVWGRFFNSSLEVELWLALVKQKKSVNVCSLGGGPGTDLIALQLFLKMKNMSNVKISGAIFDKYIEWDDIFRPLVSKFRVGNANVVFDVDYEKFDVFNVSDDSVVIGRIQQADVVTIVKFVSAVGYNRNKIQIAMEKLLKFVKPGALVFFLDNSDGDLAELMKRAAAVDANLSLLADLSRKKMRVPAGERKSMVSNGYLYGPQKNAMVSACMWMKC